MKAPDWLVLASMAFLMTGCSHAPADARRFPPAAHLSVAEAASTRETIQGYFSKLRQKQGWDTVLADDLTFTSYTSPVKRVTGKAAYLEATKRFYGSIRSFELQDLVVEGQKACALTQYELQPPAQPAFTSNVVEVFEVRGGKIHSFDIYFDTAPFPK